MKVVGFGPGEPPPLPGDAECDAFMAARGWTYAADWVPPYEDDDGERHESFWTRLIYKYAYSDETSVYSGLDLSPAVVSAHEATWALLVELAEEGLAATCKEHGVDYEIPLKFPSVQEEA